ncbi:MAG TPA: heme exporter protein CcmD [Sphingomonas sp.]|nr:heme exporter protein CcmD [Sphingomonas sp.]
MNQWGFVIAAYGVAFVGVLALVTASLVAMRRAERALEGLRRR